MTQEEIEELLIALDKDISHTLIDWLNKKMFAYLTIDGKDMFELGLAIEASKEMYNIKSK